MVQTWSFRFESRLTVVSVVSLRLSIMRFSEIGFRSTLSIFGTFMSSYGSNRVEKVALLADNDS